MTRPDARRGLGRLALIALTLLSTSLAACGSSSATTTADLGNGTISSETSVDTSDLGGRPASPAKVVIVAPAPGATVNGGSMHVVVRVDGGTITQTTSRNISPTTGHVHLYVDSVLIYMQYQLQQDVPVKPGTFRLQAEYVAADHAPFNPRVLTSEIVTVTP